MLDCRAVDEPTQPPLPDLRASDADRERAVAILARAAGDGRLTVDELEERTQLAYATRTHGELEQLLADVAVDADREAILASPSARVVPGGVRGASWVVSIMGGSERTGRWRVAERCNVVNVMGGSELDLCDAELSEQITQINVYSVMGGCEIRVPDGVEVQVSKFALMGGHEVRLSGQEPPPGAPVIRIRMVSVMGGGEVRQGRKRSRRERRGDHLLHG